MTTAEFLQTIARLTQGRPLYSTENDADPLIVAKLFDMAGSWTWYLTEYDPETHVAYGYVTGLAFDEWGTVSMDELRELRWLGIYRIEIDRFFRPTRASAIVW